MPAAVVGLALVGGGAITAATLGYVALGVTVAGMVTKNKTLMKIGGQLGLAAGVASIATSFMGAGANAASSASSAADAGIDGISAAAEDAANMGLAAPSGQMGSTAATGALSASDLQFSDNAINAAGKPYVATPDQLSKTRGGYDPSLNSPPPDPLAKYDDLTGSGIDTGAKAAPGTTQGVSQGTTQGATKNLGTSQGLNLAPTGPTTANDSVGSTSTKAKPDSDFFSFMNKDANKYAMVEGGKIIAGGIQGLAASSNANAQLEENRRVGDIQRANMASVGRGNYGLMGAR